jgi:hypothetical protein
MMQAASWPTHALPMPHATHRSREQPFLPAPILGNIREPMGACGVSYFGTRACRMPTSNRTFPLLPQPHHLREKPMVITAAHVPAIVALIAGILILIMPRLLNFIVAIYLIVVGLIGLGLLHWIHM